MRANAWLAVTGQVPELPPIGHNILPGIGNLESKRHEHAESL
jgi:hypothetical protein